MISEAELIELVFEHVCEHHPEAVAELRDEEIQRRSAVAVERALRHGFTKEPSVAAFAALMFLVGPNFDQQPAIRAALADATMSPDARMAKLMTRTKEQDWDEAGALADTAEWLGPSV